MLVLRRSFRRLGQGWLPSALLLSALAFLAFSVVGASPAAANHNPVSCAWEYGGVVETDPAPCSVAPSVNARAFVWDGTQFISWDGKVSGSNVNVAGEVAVTESEWLNAWRGEMALGMGLGLFALTAALVARFGRN